MADGKIEILAYLRGETLNIHILDGLIFTHFTVKMHGLRPAPVQGVTGTQSTLAYKRMHEQFRFLLKFTFPLHFDLIVRSCYLL